MSCDTIALHDAAARGDTDELVDLLEDGVSAGGRSVRHSERDNKGRTALWHAAARGNIECCKLLREAGADTVCMDRDGWTALHAACHGGRPGVARWLLLRQGIDAFGNGPERALSRSPMTLAG